MRARETDRSMTVLVVEDNRVERLFLETQIADLGHETMSATSADAAIELLDAGKKPVDVVLTDRMMPGMDGIELVKHMKRHRAMRNIPIVMVTGADASADISDGLNAGVFYYLPKPVDEEVLRSVLGAAIRSARQVRDLGDELKRHRQAFNLIGSLKGRFRTLEEAEALTLFAANCFPDPGEVVQGIMELAVNAVEHGILGIGYEGKSNLLAQGRWVSEVDRLCALPEHADRYAELAVLRQDGQVHVVITDPGDGFDWRRFLSIDPARASDSHGRGIARAAATCFDKVSFNDPGNRVVATAGNTRGGFWH